MAVLAITMPTALAVNRLSTHARSVQPFSACMVSTAAGRMPQLPAVGAATTRPMAAFSSLTASARYSAPPSTLPVSERPASTARRTLNAPPPVSPLVDFRSGAQPGPIHPAMTR